MTGECFVLRRASRAIFLAMIALPWLGCAGYQFGTASLYRPDIRTVYVPVFESDSFRRYLGERLTEAVVKTIELRTPYKVVDDLNADSVLSGRIVEDQKRPISEDLDDQPRDIELGLLLEVTWRDRRGVPLGPATSLPLLGVVQAVHFIPEAGQSITVAEQEAVERLAEQIVAQMEAPW